MVSQCANPECEAKFLYFRDGQVVAVEPRENSPKSVELFWLCKDCVQRMRMIIGPNGNMDLVPRYAALGASQ
jgi:hypothetical protein